MRALGIFVGFLAMCLLISALFHFPLHLFFDGLIEMPAHKQVPRLAKLLALPGFFLLIRWLDLYSREALGYGQPRKQFLQQLLIGWILGIFILFVLAYTLISLRVRIPDPIEDSFLQDLFKTLLTGLVGGLLIGLIEETFFRGAMFQAIRRHGSALSAITLTSLLYAAVHFIDPVRITEPVGWLSGLKILSGSFWQLGEWATFDSFLALFAVGAFLGLIRERTGHIAYCIGLHAGWVLVIKCTKEFTGNNHTSEWAYLTGNYDGITGYLAAGWIALLSALYLLFFKTTQNSQNNAIK